MDSWWLSEGEQTSKSPSLFVLFILSRCFCKISHKSLIVSELAHKPVLVPGSVDSCYRKVRNWKGRRKIKSVKTCYISLLQQCRHTEYELPIPSYVSFSTSIKMIMTIFYSGEMGCLMLSRAPAAISRELAKVLIELMVLIALNHVKVN